jgi:adenylate cyclase
VVLRGGDLLGGGVNIAARFEGVAEHGGICISGAAHAYVRKALPLNYTDLGEQNVKNIDEPVRVYAVRSTLAFDGPSASQLKPLPLREKPSIAVLPFENLSGQAEETYFSDGITDEIITGLARFRGGRSARGRRRSSLLYKKATGLRVRSEHCYVRLLVGSLS